MFRVSRVPAAATEKRGKRRLGCSLLENSGGPRGKGALSQPYWTTSATATLTNIMRKESPYAPVQAVSWMRNGCPYWEWPSNIQGAPRKKKCARTYSRATHKGGARGASD